MIDRIKIKGETLEVSYATSGKDLPATEWEPAERRELHIESVQAEDGSWLDVSSEMAQEIERMLGEE